MSVKHWTICMVAFAMMALSAAAQNAILPPVFRITDMMGECMVKTPTANSFEPAELMRTYPYGTAIRTGVRSSVVLTISEGNTIRLLANTDIVFNESATDSRIKNVKLNDGEVEADLEANFHQNGNALNVETATAICGAVGTRFRVASRREQDLRVVVVRVLAGIVRVYGENFQIAELGAEEWVSLLAPPDQSFLRLKNLQGNYDVTVKDEDGNDKQIPTEPESVLKIWQRTVPETGERVVTLTFNDPMGQMVESITVTFAPGEFAEFARRVQGEDDPWAILEDDRAGQMDRDRDEDPGERDNPEPPDEDLIIFIDRQIDEENIEINRNIPEPPTPSTPTPTPPSTPSPTPVGRRR